MDHAFVNDNNKTNLKKKFVWKDFAIFFISIKKNFVIFYK